MKLEINGEEIVAAQERLPSLKVNDAQIEAISAAAGALGIGSMRAALLAVRVARASAALSGHAVVEQDDMALAARLVLAPRALVFPQSDKNDQQQPPDPQSEPFEGDDNTDQERARYRPCLG